MPPNRVVDLLMYWISQGRNAADMAQFELPPQGYAGSLRGTSWDDSEMLSGYSGGL